MYATGTVCPHCAMRCGPYLKVAPWHRATHNTIRRCRVQTHMGNDVSINQSLLLNRDQVADRLLKVLQVPDNYLGYNRVMPTLLSGPPGTGKTSMLVEAAQTLGLPFYKIQCTPSATDHAVFGGPSVGANTSGSWQYFYGPAMRAWGVDGAPGFLVIDDAHNAGPDIISALFAVLDSGYGGAITTPLGETVHPSPKFHVALTMNGDPDDLFSNYEGFRDRIAVNIAVMQPSTAMINALDWRCQVGCQEDYNGVNRNPVATYRQWQTMSLLWPVVGVAEAALFALGKPEKAIKMLEALSTFDTEAAVAYSNILSGVPSGI